jgi:cyanate permease
MPRWPPLAVAWFAAFSLRAGFLGLAPVLPFLGADLGLSHARAQLILALPLPEPTGGRR